LSGPLCFLFSIKVGINPPRFTSYGIIAFG
jgi:hypothetical protein